MINIKIIEKEFENIVHGFLPMGKFGEKLYKENSRSKVLEIANILYENNMYQLKMIAVFLYGYLAYEDKIVLDKLKNEISRDKDWRVQEILAKSFDKYCSDIGYEKSLDTIEDWLNSDNPNKRRAVIEGLRIWTARPYFKENPSKAVDYISSNKDNSSKYLRKSVGNSLRDISKKYPNLIIKEINNWDLENKNILFTYKLVIKNGLL